MSPIELLSPAESQTHDEKRNKEIKAGDGAAQSDKEGLLGEENSTLNAISIKSPSKVNEEEDISNSGNQEGESLKMLLTYKN